MARLLCICVWLCSPRGQKDQQQKSAPKLQQGDLMASVPCRSLWWTSSSSVVKGCLRNRFSQSNSSYWTSLSFGVVIHSAHKVVPIRSRSSGGFSRWKAYVYEFQMFKCVSPARACRTVHEVIDITTVVDVRYNWNDLRIIGFHETVDAAWLFGIEHMMREINCMEKTFLRSPFLRHVTFLLKRWWRFIPFDWLQNQFWARSLKCGRHFLITCGEYA